MNVWSSIKATLSAGSGSFVAVPRWKSAVCFPLSGRGLFMRSDRRLFAPSAYLFLSQVMLCGHFLSVSAAHRLLF